MKLYWKLHKTTELHADLSPEESEKIMRSAVGMQFHGKANEDVWMLAHNDHNFFRPAVQVTLLPDDEGTLIRAEYRADRTLLIFMCVWSVIVIVLSFWRNPLLLVTLLLFWGAVFAGFSIGVKASDQELMSLFGAYEVL